MRPTVMKVMPIPCNGLGTSLYSIFSRMAPMETMDNVQPSPLPSCPTRNLYTEHWRDPY